MHREHRIRHRQRFLQCNGESFSDHELFELLLFYAIPRKNTNSVAHELCERFGTVDKIAEASVDELKLVDGIGNNSATLIKLVFAIIQRYIKEKNKEPNRIDTIENAVYYGRNRIFGSTKEVIYATFTDNLLNVIDTSLVAVGTIDESKPIIRSILELAIIKRASSVVVFHNHPRGGVEPSVADVNFTSLLERELDVVGINLVEHLVIDNAEFTPVLKNIRAVNTIQNHVNLDKFYEEKNKNRKEIIK